MYKSCPLFFLTNKIELIMSAPQQRNSRTVSQYPLSVVSQYPMQLHVFAYLFARVRL